MSGLFSIGELRHSRTGTEIGDLKEELVDRFGDLPEEADNLLRIVAIKGFCRRAGIAKLNAGPRGAAISFHQQSFANPQGLVAWIAGQSGTARLRPDQTVVVNRNWERVRDRLDGAEQLASTFAEIADREHDASQRFG